MSGTSSVHKGGHQELADALNLYTNIKAPPPANPHLYTNGS